ncbi:trichohyalin-like isoform X1, partial [Arapaima gigas]
MDGEQIKIGDPKEMDTDIKNKLAQVEKEDEKDDDNEKETKCDKAEIPDLKVQDTELRMSFEEPRDEENEEQFGWTEEFEATRERGQESVTENKKPQEEMQGVQSAAELGREEQRVEEEEIADKPPESITREEGKESCEVGKSREFGE